MLIKRYAIIAAREKICEKNAGSQRTICTILQDELRQLQSVRVCFLLGKGGDCVLAAGQIICNVSSLAGSLIHTMKLSLSRKERRYSSAVMGRTREQQQQPQQRSISYIHCVASNRDQHIRSRGKELWNYLIYFKRGCKSIVWYPQESQKARTASLFFPRNWWSLLS